MLAICAHYAGIMLNAFATYYAPNYAGIIGSSLWLRHKGKNMFCIEVLDYTLNFMLKC